VIRGFEKTGVTIFSVAEKMDSGDIYLTTETAIKPLERADTLFERLIGIGRGSVLEVLDMIEAGDAKTSPQDESLATYAPKLRKEDGHLDFAGAARDIVNLIHGTWPWPGAHALFCREDAEPVPVILAGARPLDSPGSDPGRIDQDLAIGTGAGRIEILEIQPANKRIMTWKDFCNGYRVSPGDCFLPPEG
jgi:methionyl-tRNA formyltransferase